jgi:hypothetical protein
VPAVAPDGWESDCKVAAEAKTYWRLACVVFDYSRPTLWQGPDPQANPFLSLKPQSGGTPVIQILVVGNIVLMEIGLFTPQIQSSQIRFLVLVSNMGI